MVLRKKHIVIIAGEASGDMHAAHLVDALKKKDSSIIFSGLGGKYMQESGVTIYQDLTKMAVVGFAEVLRHYKDLKRVFNLIVEKIDEEKVDAVILIDYPGFNFRLAKRIKKMGIKVIYYISPQVWAWKKNRIYFVKKYIDKMLVLFQFEKDFYAQHQIDVEFVGHPLIDQIRFSRTKEEFLDEIKLKNYNLTIGILPGSRWKEVERHLPIMLDAAKIIQKKYPMAQFLIIKASTIARAYLEQHTDGESALTFKIVDQDTYEAINACDACMVASGTATLETAIVGKPMVVVYKTSFLTWLLAKLFIKIPNIGLVNIVAGKRIVPECIQFEATASIIAKELEAIFTDETRLEEIKTELRKVKDSLGRSGASERAAEAILNLI